MSDKQTTAMILLIITAFIFWLYNAKSGVGNKLKDVISVITDQAKTNPANAPNPEQGVPIAPMPTTGPGVYVRPMNYNSGGGDAGMYYTPRINAIQTGNGLFAQYSQMETPVRDPLGALMSIYQSQ